MFTHVQQENLHPAIPSIITKTKFNKRWYVTPDGTFPSMTTVLGIDKAQGLLDWQARVGMKEANRIKNEAAERGTQVHLMCARYLENEPVDAIIPEFKFNEVALFKQMRLKLKGCVNNIRLLETPLWSKTYKIAGCVDCVGEYNGILSIIDFKTSTNIKTSDMIDNYFLQATGYALLYNEMYDECVEQIVIMIATEKGFIPSIFKRDIGVYVAPLLDKINIFHTKHNYTE